MASASKKRRGDDDSVPLLQIPLMYFDNLASVMYFDDTNALVHRTENEDRDRLTVAIAIGYAATDTCNVNIHPDYFTNALVSCKTMIAAKRYASNAFLGFVLAYPDPDGLYIDIICAVRGMGKPLLHEIEQSVFVRGLSVTLSAVPSIAWWYEEQGYSHQTSCAPDVIPYRNYGKPNCKQIESSTVCNRVEHVQDCYLAECKKAGCTNTKPLRNTEFVGYMLELNRRGLVNPITLKECTSKRIKSLKTKDDRIKQFSKYGCANNGLLMKKCVQSVAAVSL
jgi:hypothetical protein